nr:alpha-L-rhamnosidase C-terminal domain-containing protein [Hufsiella arboris]
MLVSGGRGSTIDIAYAESLLDSGLHKGDRNETKNRKLLGYHDVFIPDGKPNRLFSTLWYRTYRYIELTVKTKEEALEINDFYGIFTAYPFQRKAEFNSEDTSLKNIWNVGWRTARLCANETYYDCPYYEQLQYIGDTRIQALISLYVTGDDRLMRNALQMFHYSQVAEGITQSRYPSAFPQMIPPFSLYWIDMVHDYHTFRNDTAFVKQFLPGIQNVLAWYEKYINSDSLLGNVPWWNFVDWASDFEKGVPTGNDDEGSAILTLQYVYALDRAADLFSFFKKPGEAQYYLSLAEKLRQSAKNTCLDNKRQLFADTPKKTAFSQQVNILAVLTNTVPETQQKAIMEQILTDTTLTPSSTYFKFYLFEALRKSGLGDKFLNSLDSWKNMLAQNLTTFPEEENNTRSDCHAWSASPIIEFLSTVCGIEPSEAGFKTVKIEPNLGSLTSVNAKMPHPLGTIEVNLKRKASSGIQATVTLPEGLTGNFIWNNEKIALKQGKQTISR